MAVDSGLERKRTTGIDPPVRRMAGSGERMWAAKLGEQRTRHESHWTVQRSDDATVARLNKRRIKGGEFNQAIGNELAVLLTAGEKSPLVLDFSPVQSSSRSAADAMEA